MPDFKQFKKLMTQAISAAALSAALSSGAAALEPVSPQPSQPLTYTNPAYAKVTPETAKKMMAEGVVVIDVREPQEFAEGHVQGAVNVPPFIPACGSKLRPTSIRKCSCSAARGCASNAPLRS